MRILNTGGFTKSLGNVPELSHCNKIKKEYI